jgi:periplasmic protein CpxP/Spy
MDRRNIIVITAVAVLLLAAPAVYAEGDWGKGIGGGDFRKEHGWKEKKAEIYSQLGLTDQQKQELEANKAQNKEQRKAFFEKMRAKRKELNQELMKPTLDMPKIEAIQTELKSMQAQMIDDRLNSTLSVRKILSPEQFAKFITLMEERKGQWGHKGMPEGPTPEDQP